MAVSGQSAAARAPAWVDSDRCSKCSVEFTFFKRKHHCRNCGGIFCHDCSQWSLPLFHFRIGSNVRVCEACCRSVMPEKVTVSGAGNPAYNGEYERVEYKRGHPLRTPSVYVKIVLDGSNGTDYFIYRQPAFHTAPATWYFKCGIWTPYYVQAPSHNVPRGRWSASIFAKSPAPTVSY